LNGKRGFVKGAGLALIVLAGHVALSTACRDRGVPDAESSVPSAVIMISTIDNGFQPGRVETVVGTEVIWTNNGRTEHDIVSSNSGGWGVTRDSFQPGAVYRNRFVEPGMYRYYCSVHGTPDRGMVGLLVVEEID
jgi:plastocyanin